MSLGTLKWLRLITPGVLIILFASLCGWISGLWAPFLALNSDLKRLAYSLPVLLLGVVYYILEFRIQANKKYFDKVSENIRINLLRIAGFPDDQRRYTWQRLRGIFYGIVDTDPSLKIKSELAYSNGYIWTTVADVRALSAVFAIASVMVFALTFVASGSLRPLWSILFFAILYLVTFPASAALTRRHTDIGDEQIEIIEHKHLAELRKLLGEIR